VPPPAEVRHHRDQDGGGHVPLLGLGVGVRVRGRGRGRVRVRVRCRGRGRNRGRGRGRVRGRGRGRGRVTACWEHRVSAAFTPLRANDVHAGVERLG